MHLFIWWINGKFGVEYECGVLIRQNTKQCFSRTRPKTVYSFNCNKLLITHLTAIWRVYLKFSSIYSAFTHTRPCLSDNEIKPKAETAAASALSFENECCLCHVLNCYRCVLLNAFRSCLFRSVYLFLLSFLFSFFFFS